MTRLLPFASVIALALTLLAPQQTYAQDSDLDAEPIYVLFNVSLVPGLSIADAVSDASGRPVINRFSYNILAGRAYGLDGVEFGAIWNSYTGFVAGAQFGGIVNSVGGEMSGVQFAGIANMVGGEVSGAQFGGIVNISGGNVSGYQSAGIANIARGELRGMQAAGIANLASGTVDGQLSGIASIADGHVRGFQISGLASVAGDSMSGLQVSGLVNVAGGTSGGAQIAGLLNVAPEAHGLQLGVVNISRRNTGAPIGLFSYVYETGLRFDLLADESGITSGAIRSGNRRVSNYLGGGVVTTSDVFQYATTAGIGVEGDLSQTMFGAIEALFTSLHGDQWDTWGSITRLRTLGGWKLSNNVAVIAGPTFNVFVSPDSDGSDIAPWSVYDTTSGDVAIRIWPGFNAGIRFAPQGF